MPTLTRPDVVLHGVDIGSGRPFVFQHGLGASADQPVALFPPPVGIRLLAFDCRGHGRSPLGPAEGIGIVSFADDLVALLDDNGIERAVVGGISMGAAVVVNVAIRHPERVAGLVLCRPAWLASPSPPNLDPHAEIAALIRSWGAAEGRARFVLSEPYRRLAEAAPETAASLVNQFDEPRAVEAVIRLEKIPADSPCAGPDDLVAIAAPALVIGTGGDPVHPWTTAEELAALIPRARLVEVTAKSVDLAAHEAEIRTHIHSFLEEVAPW